MVFLVIHHWPGDNMALQFYCEMLYISLIRKPLFFCSAVYLKKWLFFRGYTVVK